MRARSLDPVASWLMGAIKTIINHFRRGRLLKFPSPRDQFHQGCRTCLASLAHRLSQPLTALCGSLELALLTEHTAEEYRKALEMSLEQANRLARFIRSVRELLEAETPPTFTEHVLLGELVRKAAEDLLPLAKSRHLGMSIEIAENLWVQVNSLRLQQAVIEAIQRAIQRSPEGETVYISLHASQGNACLAISDEGQAVSPEDLDRLLEPFQSGHAPPSQGNGSGLEWAIAKRIIQAAGGTIQVESKINQQCCFRIRLPLVPRKAP